ncbi:MAG: tRNA pseudouridine(38-40) synthase TruA [Synergistaceae bacterium]|jgi:tRNA pseudouridine38-40 synthase|nr:tRNA pseudouridine(38-40) synthase TruA [Synergistaceae bacterium]
MRYAARVAYVGTRYAGWQRQVEALGVQQVLEEALQRLSRKPVKVVGAGRTDSGVHAVGQVASFDMDREWEPGRLTIAANFYLPPDVSLMEARRVSEDFNARRSALWREYRYLIWHGRSCLPHLNGLVWWRKRCWNPELVREGCRVLEGSHDFRAFCKTGERPENSVRTLHRLRWKRVGDLSLLVVRAPSFLMNMVRIIVGSLDRVGRGEAPAIWLRGLLGENGALPRNREASGVTAPAGGLYFWRAAYKEVTFSRSLRRNSECSERISE